MVIALSKHGRRALVRLFGAMHDWQDEPMRIFRNSDLAQCEYRGSGALQVYLYLAYFAYLAGRRLRFYVESETKSVLQK